MLSGYANACDITFAVSSGSEKIKAESILVSNAVNKRNIKNIIPSFLF